MVRPDGAPGSARADRLRDIAMAVCTAALQEGCADIDVIGVKVFIDLARRDGFSVMPTVSTFMAWNGRWESNLAASGGAWPTPTRAAEWLHDNGAVCSKGSDLPYVHDGTADYTWQGHLVATVDEKWIVDPSISTFAHAGLNDLISYYVTEIPRGGDINDVAFTTPLPDGGKLMYRFYRAHKGYETVNAWNNKALFKRVRVRSLEHFDGFASLFGTPRLGESYAGKFTL